MTTRYLICGGRDFDDWAMLDRALNVLILHPKASVIIHGAANGADHLADQWAKERRAKEIIAVPADWKAHGRAAGPIRNSLMLSDYRPDVIIAFPGGAGTDDMIRQGREQKLVVIQVVG